MIKVVLFSLLAFLFNFEASFAIGGRRGGQAPSKTKIIHLKGDYKDSSVSKGDLFLASTRCEAQCALGKIGIRGYEDPGRVAFARVHFSDIQENQSIYVKRVSSCFYAAALKLYELVKENHKSKDDVIAHWCVQRLTGGYFGDDKEGPLKKINFEDWSVSDTEEID